EAEMTLALKKLIETQPENSIPQFTLEPRSFVKSWTLKDFGDGLDAGVKANRHFANGRKMAGAGSCYVCHRFKGEGGAVGPDLSSAGGKFSAYDLLESIIDPGKEISDQYGATNFKLNDGTVVSGRIMNLTEELYHVNTDMMQPSTITFVPVNDLVSIEASPISMMPPGLINTMSEDDVLDLLAYFISGGDPKHPAFNDREVRK
ncbi:MAG: c-type cytochrome, partial [Limisphaerales bacterium]